MRLPAEQVERFYAIWKPLILFVNRRCRIVPEMLDATVDEPWDFRKVYQIREALWADDSLREAFIAENPAGLPPADVAIVDSWKYRVAGMFCVFRHLKQHSILIGEKGPDVYAVLGLASSLREVVPFTPCYVKAVLLPFEDRIIYDSLLVPYNILLGPGIRRSLNETYRDARERGAISTSLLPRAEPVDREEEQAGAREVNVKVLDVFRKHLFRSGLSPKVVERDVATAGAFAADYLITQAESRSLRDFRSEDVRDYLAQLPSQGLTAARRKESITGMTRLVRFLRDTGRIDYYTSQEMLAILREGT